MNKQTYTDRLDQWCKQAAAARAEISKGESAIWAEGTPYTAADLEEGYESEVFLAFQRGGHVMSFIAYCECECGINPAK